jgi:hypothetical protein
MHARTHTRVPHARTHARAVRVETKDHGAVDQGGWFVICTANLKVESNVGSRLGVWLQQDI